MAGRGQIKKGLESQAEELPLAWVPWGITKTLETQTDILIYLLKRSLWYPEWKQRWQGPTLEHWDQSNGGGRQGLVVNEPRGEGGLSAVLSTAGSEDKALLWEDGDQFEVPVG